jgi:uncharacterized membrane protein
MPKLPHEPTEDDEIDAQERAFWARLRPTPGCLVVLAVLQVFPGCCITSSVLYRWLGATVGEMGVVIVAFLFHVALIVVFLLMAWQLKVDAMERAESRRQAELRAAANRGLKARAAKRRK